MPPRHCCLPARSTSSASCRPLPNLSTHPPGDLDLDLDAQFSRMCSVIAPGCPGVGPPMTPPQQQQPPVHAASASINSDHRLSPPHDLSPAPPPRVDHLPAPAPATAAAPETPNHIGAVNTLSRGDYCRQCGATETPQWRNGPAGPRSLCNACGIRLHRQSQKEKQKGLRVTKKISKASRSRSSPNPRTPSKAAKSDSSKSEDWPLKPSSTPEPQEDKRIKGARYREASSENHRPRRRAALVAIETTREFTKGIRRGHYSRWHPRRHRIIDCQNLPHVVSPDIVESMEPVDFTGAVDLVGLSRSTSSTETPYRGAVAAKLEELGQDLLSHLTEISQSSMMELQGIERELLSAHWEMQASEMAEQAVAQVLTEQKRDLIKKRTRYWRARDRLEKFIHANQAMK